MAGNIQKFTKNLKNNSSFVFHNAKNTNKILNFLYIENVGVLEEQKENRIKEKKNMKKNNKQDITVFRNKFTGEELSTYPTPFAKLSTKTSKRTKDEKKLQKQIDAFQNRNICKFCGGTKEWIPGTNVVVCKNPDCKGHVIKAKNKEGKEIEISEPSMKILTKRGAAIAETLLG